MLKKYYREQSGNITKFIKKGEVSEESMHECRIAIKKIRALFQLLVWRNDEFDYRNAEKPFRILFQLLGAAREFQVDLKLRNDLGISGDDENEERRKYHIALRELFKKLDKSLIKKIRNRDDQVNAALDQLSKKRLNRYIGHVYVSLVKRLQAGVENPQKLHSLRKRVKISYYNFKALPELEAANKSLTEQLDGLQRLLGDWHDLEEMVSKFKEQDGMQNKLVTSQIPGLIAKQNDIVAHISNSMNEVLARQVKPKKL